MSVKSLGLIRRKWQFIMWQVEIIDFLILAKPPFLESLLWLCDIQTSVFSREKDKFLFLKEPF